MCIRDRCEYSPAQLLFSRTLRTRIPTLSATTTSDSVRRNLQAIQDRQKFYHDQHTRPLSSLQSGDAVRVHNGHSWQAAKVISAHSSPRSYNIQTDTGTQLRRNRRDLIHTREDPPVCARHIDEDVPSATSPPVQQNAGPRPCSKTSSG